MAKKLILPKIIINLVKMGVYEKKMKRAGKRFIYTKITKIVNENVHTARKVPFLQFIFSCLYSIGLLAIFVEQKLQFSEPGRLQYLAVQINLTIQDKS